MKNCKRSNTRGKGDWSFETKIHYFAKYITYRLPHMQEKRREGNPFD